MKSVRSHLVVLICCVGALVASVIPAVAMAANYSVVPMAFNLNVAKRDIVTETITVTNTTARQVRLYASVNEVAVDGMDMVESFVEPSLVDKTVSPTSWIEITRARLELAPGESREIPFTVRMNPNTQPGEYSVYIGFAEASNSPEATKAVMEGRAEGTLVNLVVDKKQDHNLALEGFVVNRFVTGRGSDEITYMLHNPGIVDVVHAGEIIFYNTRGIEVATVSLNASGTPVSVGAHQSFLVSIPNELGLGKYKAYLSVEYGANLTESVQDTAYFYLTPFRELLIIFSVILILAVAITLYVHRKYDIDTDDHGAEPVALYIKNTVSPASHRDINLKPTVTDSEHA